MSDSEYVIMQDPGCGDMFFGAYTRSQWAALKQKPRTVLQILKYNQTGFLATQVIHFAIFLVWCLATRVPGFNLYDGSEAVNANTHSGWWLMADVMVLAMGLLAPYFTLHYTRDNQKETVETGVKATANWLMAYSIVAFLGGVMSLVHAVLSCFEYSGCDSATFCRDYRYMHIAMIVILFVLTLLLWWSAAMAHTYRLNIEGATFYGGLQPTIMTTDISGGGGGDMTSGFEVVTDNGPKAQIMTPLMQMRMQQKIRHTAARTTVGMK